MNRPNASVIVYLKQPEHNRDISQNIASLNGVRKTRISERANSMICVDYDPRTTDSRHILQSVTSQGIDARLVGM